MGSYQLKRNRHLLLNVLNLSQKDCAICNPPASVPPKAKSAQHWLITKTLSKKYMTSRDYYDAKIVNDIVYNEPTRLVSVFKDYLIYDDVSEFLKRFYTQ